MKITFILPYVNLTGGIKILFEHANRLAVRGHRVTIVYPGKLFHGDNYEISTESWRWHAIDVPLRQLKYGLFVSLLGKTEAEWFPLDPQVTLRRTPDLSARFIPDSDIIIATAPETVNWVATYPDTKGIKVHLAQDYEVWYLPEKFVDSTFAHPEIHLITIGTWQKKLYEERFQRHVEAIIPDGVDTARFNAENKRYADDPKDLVRVLLSYHHAAYKGMADGLAAIEQARKAGLAIQIVAFGVHPLKDDMPSDIEYHQNIAEADLPDLYRSCDIFLWPTHREGFGLPPLEAMACGTPVVGTDAGAMPDFMKDGKTGYIVPIKQPKQLGEKLIKLASDPKLREKMGRSAAEEAKKWDWDFQTEKLEQYLKSLHEQST